MEENKMATTPIKKLVLTTGIPLMISLLISNLYNFVDSIFVAHISEKALTALSLANPIQVLMSALGMANAVGLNAAISKALGKKDQKEVEQTATSAIWLAFIFWLILATLSLFILKPYFLSQSNHDLEITNYGISYLRICMLASLGFMGQWVFDRFTISSGKTHLFLITLSSGAIVNIILDPIFIFGYFGLPQMGIAGAAIATIIGQFVGATMGIIINKKYNKEIPIHFSFVPNFKCVKNILSVGVPSGIAQAMLSMMGIYVNSILIHFSSTAVAVNGVLVKIQSLILVPIWGLNNGLVPLVAYNYGAHQLKRSFDSLKWSLIYEYGTFIILLILLELFPSKILYLFDASKHMLQMGVPAMRILGVAYLISIVSLALSSTFQGFSMGLQAMILTLSRQVILLFIFLTFFKSFNQINLIWFAYILAEVCCLPIGYIMYKKIKKKVIEEIS